METNTETRSEYRGRLAALLDAACLSRMDAEVRAIEASGTDALAELDYMDTDLNHILATITE